jgi:tetratricopeptide (TPR) repeat protein
MSRRLASTAPPGLLRDAPGLLVLQPQTVQQVYPRPVTRPGPSEPASYLRKRLVNSERLHPTMNSCSLASCTSPQPSLIDRRNHVKAFLSHSSNDAAIVSEVARRIGRAFVTIDVAAFHAPDDLIQSIESAVRDSAIFVYFASRPAMSSTWVNFELNEARYHQAMSRLKKLIVVLLDDRLQPADFPEWMRRYVFLKSHAARPIARAIRGAIDDMVSEEQSGFFVGRASETAALQAALVPPDTDSDVSIVTVRGLPGVGRRTLLQRVVRDSLYIDRLLTVRVEIGDNANSIAAKLADLVEPIITPDDTLAMVREIQSLPLSSVPSRFASDVNRALQLHELVVLYDQGGVLDNNGFLTTDIESLLQEVTSQPSLLVALVTNRRPRLRGVPDLEDFPIVDVNPLRESEVRQLIALTAKSRGLNLPLGTVGALAEQAKGYPPAVIALVGLAEVYGPELVTTSTSGRSEYQPRPLTRYLASLSLSQAERKMVAVLARNSPFPLTILMLFGPDGQEAVSALTKLIDASLVMPQVGTSWYRISDPAFDYIDREFPPCTIEDYTLVANELDKFLDEDRETGAYLDLSRVLYRALIHAGQTKRPRAYALLADWLRLAQDFYHQRNYEKALDFATTAYMETPGHEALSWIIRSKIKLGKFPEALSDIGVMRTLGQIRDAHFLRGFLERNRGEYRAAITHYEQARQAGWRGLALERDLAECYFQVGNLERAAAYIEAAQSRQSDNPYVLSLRIKIACRQFDEETARSLLPLLEQVDSATFAAHRRSMVELTFGNIVAAREYALKAVQVTSRPPAEALANLAHCQILMDQPAQAIQTLDRLESLYGQRWSDVLNSLRARAAIAELRYEDAWAFCNLLIRDSAVHKRLKSDALRGWLESVYLPPEERLQKERMLAELESQLVAAGDTGERGEYYWNI